MIGKELLTRASSEPTCASYFTGRYEYKGYKIILSSFFSGL
jgi:hypothetical protein